MLLQSSQDETNEKTEMRGSTSPFYSVSLEVEWQSKKQLTYPVDFSILITPKCITAAGRSVTVQPARPHVNMLLSATCHCLFHYLRATTYLKNPEINKIKE